MVKQYTIEVAYSSNTRVNMYEDGILTNYEIISDWNLLGYLDRIEDEGYEKAYDIRKYKNALKEAEERYNMNKEALERAMKNPLIGSDKKE